VIWTGGVYMKLFNPMLPPWIVMFTAFVFFVKGLEDHAFLLLYTLAVLGLYYLSREDRTLTIIIHWNLLGMAAGLLLLWQNCAKSQWAMAGLAGFCVILQIIRIYKLIMK